jgi:hypothetical protein
MPHKDDYHAVQELLRKMQETAVITQQTDMQAEVESEVKMPFKFVAQPSFGVARIPTFEAGVSLALSPMLEARFGFASAIYIDTDTWLNTTEMLSWTRKRAVKSYHRSLRENWDDSAPMLYSDSQLSLFGITEDVPDSLVYLVWTGSTEPEIWLYSGMQHNRFTTLRDYFEWYIGNG